MYLSSRPSLYMSLFYICMKNGSTKFIIEKLLLLLFVLLLLFYFKYIYRRMLQLVFFWSFCYRILNNNFKKIFFINASVTVAVLGKVLCFEVIFLEFKLLLLIFFWNLDELVLFCWIYKLWYMVYTSKWITQLLMTISMSIKSKIAKNELPSF